MIPLNQVTYVRSNGADNDFVENCRLLDKDLDRRGGKVIQRDKYQQFNTLDKIKECIIVYVDGKLVGAGAIRLYDEESNELERVFVKQEAQGQGIGTELVKQLIAWSKELGGYL